MVFAQSSKTHRTRGARSSRFRKIIIFPAISRAAFRRPQPAVVPYSPLQRPSYHDMHPRFGRTVQGCGGGGGVDE